VARLLLEKGANLAELPVVMDDDDGFDLLRGYGVYVHLCTVQIGARLRYMVRARTTLPFSFHEAG